MQLPEPARELLRGKAWGHVITLNAGGTPILARLTTRAVHQLQLQPGQSVWAQIKAVSLVQ